MKAAANKHRKRQCAFVTARETSPDSAQQQQQQQQTVKLHKKAQSRWAVSSFSAEMRQSASGKDSDASKRCSGEVDDEATAAPPLAATPARVPRAQLTEDEVRFMGFPAKPMVKCGNAYYRAEVLEVDWGGQRVKLSYDPDHDPVSEHFWLPFSSNRIWKGSHAHRHWERVGLGAWIPLISRSAAHPVPATAVTKQPPPTKGERCTHAIKAAGSAHAARMKHGGICDPSPVKLAAIAAAAEPAAAPALPATPATAIMANAIAVPLQMPMVDTSCGQHPLVQLLQQLQGPEGQQQLQQVKLHSAT